jgi:hypothetical protein
MTTQHVMNHEEGNVLVITLIILVALTFLGITSTRMSSIDLLVSGNKKIYTQNLYNAEAAAYYAVQTMNSTDLAVSPPGWYSDTLGAITEADILVDANWDNDFGGDVTVGTFNGDNDIRFVSIYSGVAEVGMSLDMAKTKIRQYSVYGRSEKSRGKSMVEIGFRKAF